MSDTNTLYDEDFFAWTKQQAKALRVAARGMTNQPIDWENLAEEIESLGRSDRREVASQIRRIVEHLIKLSQSRASDPRLGWRASINDARVQIETVLDDSPSLQREVPEIIRRETARGARLAISDLKSRGELDALLERELRAGSYPALFSYTAEQILGDWFPPEPAPQQPARGRRTKP